VQSQALSSRLLSPPPCGGDVGLCSRRKNLNSNKLLAREFFLFLGCRTVLRSPLIRRINVGAVACRRDFPIVQILKQGSSITRIMMDDRYLAIRGNRLNEYRNCLFVVSFTTEDFQDWNGRLFPRGSSLVLFWDKRKRCGYACFETPPILPGP
jgi:hypothetical protein